MNRVVHTWAWRINRDYLPHVPSRDTSERTICQRTVSGHPDCAADHVRYGADVCVTPRLAVCA